MSGSKINQNGSSSITLTNLISVLDAQRVGYSAISLSYMGTTSMPTLGSGSCCEIAGSLYRYSTAENISTSNVTSTSNCKWYVELVPSSSIVTTQFSTTVPVWREDYQGWYESTISNRRIVGGLDFLSGSYIGKFIYEGYFMLPQYYQSKSTYVDIASGLAQRGAGTNTFTFTFDYTIDSIISYNLYGTWISAANDIDTFTGVTVDSITATNNQVVLIARYWWDVTSDSNINGESFRISAFASIVGR